MEFLGISFNKSRFRESKLIASASITNGISQVNTCFNFSVDLLKVPKPGPIAIPLYFEN